MGARWRLSCVSSSSGRGLSEMPKVSASLQTSGIDPCAQRPRQRTHAGSTHVRCDSLPACPCLCSTTGLARDCSLPQEARPALPRTHEAPRYSRGFRTHANSDEGGDGGPTRGIRRRQACVPAGCRGCSDRCGRGGVGGQMRVRWRKRLRVAGRLRLLVRIWEGGSWLEGGGPRC